MKNFELQVVGKSPKHVFKIIQKYRKHLGMESGARFENAYKRKPKGSKATVEYPYSSREIVEYDRASDSHKQLMGNIKKHNKVLKKHVYEKGASIDYKKAFKNTLEREKSNYNGRRAREMSESPVYKRKQMAKEAADSTFQFRKGQAEAATKIKSVNTSTSAHDKYTKNNGKEGSYYNHWQQQSWLKDRKAYKKKHGKNPPKLY